MPIGNFDPRLMLPGLSSPLGGNTGSGGGGSYGSDPSESRVSASTPKSAEHPGGFPEGRFPEEGFSPGRSLPCLTSSCLERSLESGSAADMCIDLTPPGQSSPGLSPQKYTPGREVLSPPGIPAPIPLPSPSGPLYSSQNFYPKTEGEVCFGCGNSITERYLLKVSGRAWHVTCLRCSVCQSHLDRQSSCFIKDENIYCKLDYSRQFGTKCSKCLRHIQSTDWVRRAKNNVYHLACFSCDSCKRQLSTGEEFALQDSRVLCKTHYIELIEGGSNTDEFGEFSSDETGSQKQKTKRVRTTFTEEQLQVLQANFQLDSNPDGQDLERIAQITGLSKRVTQVWFQNSRARQKKHQQTAQNRINSINNLSTSLSSSISISTSLSSPSPGGGDSMYHQALTMSPLKSVYIDTSGGS